MNAYTVHLLAGDGTFETVHVEAEDIDHAEVVALAVAEVRWPDREWLVSHVEGDAR